MPGVREGTRGASSCAASPSPALPPVSAQRCVTVAGTVALKGGKIKSKVLGAAWLCVGWLAGCWLSRLLPGKVSGWLW